MNRLLWYGDAPTAATGFGTVSRNVLAAFHATGNWDITVRGVNFFGTLHQFPYRIMPAGTPDNEPQGVRAFLRDIASEPFDLVIINNDFQVVNPLAVELKNLLPQLKHHPKLIYYYPVDLEVPAGFTDLIRFVDQPVAYSRFGEAETIATIPGLPLAVIPHGSETNQRISEQDRQTLREQAFGIGPDTFLWMMVNRNNVRKDIPRTIEAFRAFHSFQPDSKLYLHCQPIDQGGNMEAAANELGLKDSVAFPGNFMVSNGGMPRDMLMQVYQLADGFITTHLGEGWGLTVTEAMAAGLPVVAPYNTTMPEILGAEYPYLYPMSDLVRKDDSGFRPRGSVRDIFLAMKKLYLSQKEGLGHPEHQKLPTWPDVGTMWLQLAGAVLARPRVVPVQSVSETV